MASLTNYFKKHTPKTAEIEEVETKKKKVVRKQRRGIIGSDEEPIDTNTRGKKYVKDPNLSSDGEDFVSPPKRKKSANTSQLFEKLQAQTKKLQEIDPDKYFELTTTKSAPIPKPAKVRVENKIDDFLAEDDESILSNDEGVPKKKKTAAKNDSKDDTPRKMPAFLQALNRAPGQFIGQRELPIGAKNCLQDLTIVVTGVFEYFEREDVISLIKRYGGRNTTTISGRTDYVVVAREPGESKLSKAQKLGVNMLSEEEFYKLISDTYVKENEPKKVSKVVKASPAPPSAETLPRKHDETNQLDLWVDKYKPKCLQDVVGQQGAKSPANKLVQWLKDWERNRREKPKNFFAGKENGSVFKAALLSGQPGVGKTTTAVIACRELGYDVVELNASDTRSKKVLDSVLGISLSNCRISGSVKAKSVLIMDEVDGMSGNEDRGGVQELIAFIKSTKVPIICICNDRMHPKIRSLSNHCFDLRFYKPRAEQIKTYIMGICSKEGIQIDPQAAEQMAVSAHNDIRQVVNNLQMWSASKRSFDYDEVRAETKSSERDVKENLFEVTRKIFNKTSDRFTLIDKSDLFFVDYSIMPLFVHENYLNVVSSNEVSRRLSNIAHSANLISLGSKCDERIRTSNDWSLLPTMGMLSCVLPTEYTSGPLGGQISFPQWLGKNSTTNKSKRMIQELCEHMHAKCRVTKKDLVLDYIPYMHESFYNPLIEEENDGVDEVIERLQNYDLLKDDWEYLIELSQWSDYTLPSIPTKTKASFTRKSNKSEKCLPYVISSASKSRKVIAVDNEDDDEENSEEQENNDDKNDKMVKVLSTPVPKKSTTKAPAKRGPRKVKT